jgi:Golgi nucleoside diphosphatase
MLSLISIYSIGATAGLRLLNITNPSYINTLLNNTRAYFSTLGLLFGAPESQVRIIAGSEEGLDGWISANMLMQELFENDNPFDTYGVLDMGGMSKIK